MQTRRLSHKKTETAERQRAWAQRAKIHRAKLWRDDPVCWAHDVLSVDLTPQQVEVARAFVKHDRVAVASGNGVGKTNLAAVLELWWPATRRGFVILTGPNWDQVYELNWSEVRKLYADARIPLGGRLMAGSPFWRIEPWWGIRGVATDRESRMHGSHAAQMAVIFEEAQGIDDKFWTAAEGMMAGGNCKWLAIGNPLQPSGEFHRCFRRRSLWKSIHLSCLDHPNVVEKRDVIPGAVTHKWVEERRSQWGEDDPRYISRVLGRFPSTGSNKVIPLGYLESSAESGKGDPNEGVHLGVDVARFGQDETVVAVCRQGKIQAPLTVLPAPDTREIDYGAFVAGKVVRIAKKYGLKAADANWIHVDTGGVGASVVDALRALGWRIDAVDFGSKARGAYADLMGREVKLANMRAEMYWAARELLRRGLFVIPENISGAWEQLTEPSYHHNRRDEIILEPKETIRKRLGRSPDSADAIVLTRARRKLRKPQVIFLP